MDCVRGFFTSAFGVGLATCRRLSAAARNWTNSEGLRPPLEKYGMLAHAENEKHVPAAEQRGKLIGLLLRSSVKLAPDCFPTTGRVNAHAEFLGHTEYYWTKHTTSLPGISEKFCPEHL